MPADLIPPVGQDRLKLWHICQAILPRSESGEPELQRTRESVSDHGSGQQTSGDVGHAQSENSQMTR